jgi:hypothetical protein
VWGTPLPPPAANLNGSGSSDGDRNHSRGARTPGDDDDDEGRSGPPVLLYEPVSGFSENRKLLENPDHVGAAISI